MYVLFRDKMEIGRFDSRDEAVNYAWSLIGYYQDANLDDFIHEFRRMTIYHTSNPWFPCKEKYQKHL